MANVRRFLDLCFPLFSRQKQFSHWFSNGLNDLGGAFSEYAIWLTFEIFNWINLSFSIIIR